MVWWSLRTRKRVKERSKEWAVRACRDFATLRQLMAFPPYHKKTALPCFSFFLSSPPVSSGSSSTRKRSFLFRNWKFSAARKQHQHEPFRWAPLIKYQNKPFPIQWYQTNCIYSLFPSHYFNNLFFFILYFHNNDFSFT